MAFFSSCGMSLGDDMLESDMVTIVLHLYDVIETGVCLVARRI